MKKLLVLLILLGISFAVFKMMTVEQEANRG